MAATHTQDVIESVRQSLIEGATFGEIGSRLGVTRAVINGIVARNSMIGLSQHRDTAKSKPIEAKPIRPNVVVKFPGPEYHARNTAPRSSTGMFALHRNLRRLSPRP